MTIELFDIYCNLGPRIGSNSDEPETLPELLRMREHYQIQESLIGHHFSIYGDVDVGNQKALEAAKGGNNLWAVGSISPEFNSESASPKDYLEYFIRQKGRAMRIHPKYRLWSTEDWCAKNLLDALEERQLPILLPWQEASASDINKMMSKHKNLSCILLDLDYRNHRKLIPLLQCHKKLSVCIGPRFSGHEGIEILVDQVGSEKIIFGTRYPECDPGATISMLLYARISEIQKIQIANKNIKQLIEEVQL